MMLTCMLKRDPGQEPYHYKKIQPDLTLKAFHAWI